MKVLQQLMSRLISKCTHDIHVWLSYLKCCRRRRLSDQCRFCHIRNLRDWNSTSSLTNNSERSDNNDC